MARKRCPNCRAEVVEVLGQIRECPGCGTGLKDVECQIPGLAQLSVKTLLEMAGGWPSQQEIDGALEDLARRTKAEREVPQE